MDQLPFIPNKVYNRRAEIHAQYGGNWQSGICPSSEFPFIFIFTGKTGHQHGYMDGWENVNVFSYTGEGQKGDMQFTKGNLALRDHIQKGKRVFLFESVSKGFVRFISEVEVFNADYFETHDTSGGQRIGIKFFFKRKGAVLPQHDSLLNQVAEPKETFSLDQPTGTEMRRFVTTRVGQGAYRKSIIHRWEYKCAVTGFDRLDVLVASHIVPWAEGNDDERLDVHNGILLSPTFDALFDMHLISFENNGKIILSGQIERQAFSKIGVTGDEKIAQFSDYNRAYLERHRSRFGEVA